MSLDGKKILLLYWSAPSETPPDLSRIPSFAGLDVLIIESHLDPTAQAHSPLEKRGRLFHLKDTFGLDQGGNFKTGFHFALQENYDGVITLPHFKDLNEKTVGELSERLFQGKADVVTAPGKLGWLGRLIQKKGVGTGMSGLFSGLRAYKTTFLRKIPFDLNSNATLFNFEIFLQALASDSSIEKMDTLSSPQYPFWGALKAAVKYRFQRIGFFTSMQYRGLLAHQEKYQDKSQFPGSTHSLVLDLIPTAAKVLDMGSGRGYLAGHLTQAGAQVVGMDKEPVSSFPGEKFIQRDFESAGPPDNLSDFDYVVMLDLLEHLSDPESLLIECRYRMDPGRLPTFFFSTGNVAFFGVRLLLTLGVFNYGERGILDVTHKRLFTLASFRRLLRDTGFKLTQIKGVGIPFELVFPNFFGRMLRAVSNGLARMWPSLFAYQFVVVAKPLPHSAMLLRKR